MVLTFQTIEVGKGGSKFRVIMKSDDPARREDIRVKVPANRGLVRETTGVNDLFHVTINVCNGNKRLRIFLHNRCVYKLRLYGNIDQNVRPDDIRLSKDGLCLTITMTKLTAVTESWMVEGRCSSGPSDTSDDDTGVIL